MRFRSALPAMLVIASAPALADCFDAAGTRYQVSSSLLRAIARVESGGRSADVENKNRDGSRDIGRMQINTSWLPTLKRWGIGEEQLRDECVSINVGAWIVAQNLHALGTNWDGVAAYNVGCRSLPSDECARRRNRYAWRVYTALRPSEKSAQTPFADPRPRIGAIDFALTIEETE